jgi:hypothetical protein
MWHAQPNEEQFDRPGREFVCVFEKFGESAATKLVSERSDRPTFYKGE